MSLDLDALTGERVRDALNRPHPPLAPGRDLTGAALRDGRTRVRRRRIVGLAAGTALTCAAALAVPAVVTGLAHRGGTSAANTAWADPTTQLGEILAGIDDTVSVSETRVSMMDAQEWIVGWYQDPAHRSVHRVGNIDVPGDSWLRLRVDGDVARLSLGGVGRSDASVGSFPLPPEPTAVSIRLPDGRGWLGMLIDRGAARGPVAQMHLAAADYWATVDRAMSGTLVIADGDSATSITDGYVVVQRMSPDSPTSPWDAMRLFVGDADIDHPEAGDVRTIELTPRLVDLG